MTSKEEKRIEVNFSYFLLTNTDLHS